MNISCRSLRLHYTSPSSTYRSRSCTMPWTDSSHVSRAIILHRPSWCRYRCYTISFCLTFRSTSSLIIYTTCSGASKTLGLVSIIVDRSIHLIILIRLNEWLGDVFIVQHLSMTICRRCCSTYTIVLSVSHIDDVRGGYLNRTVLTVRTFRSFCWHRKESGMLVRVIHRAEVWYTE